MAGFIFCSSAHSIRESKPDQYLAKSANLRRMLQEGGGDAVEQAPSETPGIAAAPPAELVADRQRLQQEISARKNASTGISAEEEEGARMSAALEASERTKSQVHDDFSACSVTIACEPCPSEALRDQAEYCLKTGWRQRMKCVFRISGKEEMFFESCAVPGIFVAQSSKVMQFEIAMLLCLAGSWTWMQKRKRLQPGRGGEDKKSLRAGGYEPLTTL
eukprot:CAMPEP_0177727240 /NCGR_PEP_ID=MMETSP0484_2-20121128/20211_1 /TAXON_ID=354590 /ORGANISM="Rhodomonas lens, Strain RHODO" /LENGTH=217 /DNA_ID=CAMNT_0019239871 /DNA_START=75 /DNA_END=728 /DNA_ORIENTATION=+